MVLVGNSAYFAGGRDFGSRFFLSVDGNIGICNGSPGFADTSSQYKCAGFSFFRTVGCNHHPITSDHPLLNKRGVQYLGRVFSLYEPIKNGQGKIKVDDSIWKVHGEDCDINTQVKVIAVRGTVFEVEKVD